mmetsp:Transcript_1688/g.2258  ORF Transcript_1688/g.2258 Transcript_1688/m.2258 type:complete len:448 (-) Transcript_1688:195-1538(-)
MPRSDITTDSETSSSDSSGNGPGPRIYSNNGSSSRTAQDKRGSRHSDEMHSASSKDYPQQYSENSSEQRPGSSSHSGSAQLVAIARGNRGDDDDRVVFNKIGPPLKGKGISEASILRAFSQIDCDGNSYIGSKDLIKTLRAAKRAVTDLDIERMVRAVDEDGDGQISLPEFREFVYTKLIGIPREHYSSIPVPAGTEFNVPHNRRVKRTLKGAKAVDTKHLSEAIEVKRPSAGKVKVVKMTDIEMEKNQTRRERIDNKYGTPVTNHERKEIPRLRNVFFSFTQELQLNLFTLEESYYKCVHAVRDELGMVTFKQFCDSYGVEGANVKNAREIFDTFKVGNGKRAPAHMLAMACLSVLRAPAIRKLNLLFIIQDPGQTGEVHKDDVKDMIAVAECSHNFVQWKSKLVVLMGDRNAMKAKKSRFKKNIMTVETILFPITEVKEKEDWDI